MEGEETHWCCAKLDMKTVAVKGEASITLTHTCGRCTCCIDRKCPNKLKKLFLASKKKQKN